MSESDRTGFTSRTARRTILGPNERLKPPDLAAIETEIRALWGSLLKEDKGAIHQDDFNAALGIGKDNLTADVRAQFFNIRALDGARENIVRICETAASNGDKYILGGRINLEEYPDGQPFDSGERQAGPETRAALLQFNQFLGELKRIREQGQGAAATSARG